MNGSVNACRSCGHSGLRRVLSLGEMPLANALLSEEALSRAEARYPLDVLFCPQCALLQIGYTVPPEQLFRHYLYLSSYSDTMVRHAERLAGRLVATRRLGRDSLVLEVASNDGYLLQFYQRAGVPVLGVEPAENIAKVAVERGIPTRCAFFGRSLAEALQAEGVAADVVHAHNVLAHVADLNGFVAGLAGVLKERGVAVIEVPYVRDLLEACEFDTIYHEHLCYFSVTSLDRLFRRHGLVVSEVERVEIHGGSLRLYVGRNGTGRGGSASVEALLRAEADAAVDKVDSYLAFANRVAHVRSGLRDLLHSLKAAGHTLAAYGASAKGSTLLNFCGIGRDVLEFVVDRSPVKQGQFMPGVHLPIFPPGHLLERLPEYVLLLTWNFAEEILEQQAEYRRRGGRFVSPIPEPHVLS